MLYIENKITKMQVSKMKIKHNIIQKNHATN